MNLTPEQETLLALAQETYSSLFAGREGSPDFPSTEELAKHNFDLVFWANEVHQIGYDLMNRLARVHQIPVYPVNQGHPTQTAAGTIAQWGSSLRMKPRTAYPWIPLHNLGPYMLVGHFAPASTDFAGIPSRLCLRALISREDYDRCHKAAMELLDNPNPASPIADIERIDLVPLLTQMRLNAEPGADVDAVKGVFAKDPLIQTVEDLRHQCVPILPHDAIMIDERTANAIPREISIREPAVCYVSIGNTHYVLTPRPAEAYKIQDEINQSIEDAQSSVRIVGVYAEEPAVRALLERDSRSLADLTGGGRVDTALLGQHLMTLDAVRLSQVAKKELMQEDNANLFMEWIVYRAIVLQASDIHLERVDTEARVRYRINGSLIEAVFLPLELLPKLLNVVKIYCSMPVVEKRKSMDGSFPIIFGSKRLDARVSMIPHFSEMSCVVRVNSRGMEKATIEGLRMTPRNHSVMMESASVRTGIVFITGPTGSGKTTTLYSLLNHLNTPDRNIVTLEEPIEYHIPGIKQFQINRAAGLDYEHYWKGVLRHDPNVILIGEIRDHETARQAIVAAHTGHLVFTTLHTNNAAGVVPRMLGLGIEPAELADALVCVQAQRLVRILCPHCSRPREMTAEEIAVFKRHDMPAPSVVRDANRHGCRTCNSTGYINRQAIMETMPAIPAFIDAVISGAPTRDLIRVQRTVGYRDLFEEGLLLAAEGLTTMEEAGGWKRAFSDFDRSNFAAAVNTAPGTVQ